MPVRRINFVLLQLHALFPVFKSPGKRAQDYGRETFSGLNFY